MQLRHVVVAADETEASRNAMRTALLWADRTGADVKVISVCHGKALPAGSARGSAAGAIERWLRDQLKDDDGSVPEIAESVGIPSIEIARFAEAAGADLLILGRKPRSGTARQLIGDTADAVARRSPVPCLFVPGPDDGAGRILAAWDGTTRGLAVPRSALDLGRALGVAVDFVTVERVPPGDLGKPHDVPLARTDNLVRALGPAGSALRVRRGEVVAELLGEVELRRPRILVLGYRRGGPPGPIEGESVARRLAHRAPCAVLTIPL